MFSSPSQHYRSRLDFLRPTREIHYVDGFPEIILDFLRWLVLLYATGFVVRLFMSILFLVFNPPELSRQIMRIKKLKEALAHQSQGKVDEALRLTILQIQDQALEFGQGAIFSRDYFVRIPYLTVRRGLLGWIWLIFNLGLLSQLYFRTLPLLFNVDLWECRVFN